jgi:lipopolysaccharide/colanic/teichoic acid biosynthesis glycosyltransferase
LVLSHELWQQCFQGIAIPITLQSHALSNHFDMAVIVMAVIVMVIVMVVLMIVVVGQGSGVMFKPQHHS